MTTDIPLLPSQLAFLEDPSDHAAIRGGVGSGKTHLLTWWTLAKRLEPFPDGQHFIVGADFQQLTRGAFVTIKGILDEAGIRYEFTKSPHPQIRLEHNGGILDAVSIEQEERIRSLEADTFWLEEPQTWRNGSEIYKTLMGRLRGSPPGRKYGRALQPQMRMSFNPPAKSSWLYELIETRNAMPCERFSVRDNYLIRGGLEGQQKYIKLLESTYPEKRWPVEIDGNWSEVGGNVYYGFSRKLHTEPPDDLPGFGFDPRREIVWTLDFNVEWMASLIGQVHVQPMVAKGIVPVTQFSTVVRELRGPLVDNWQRRIHYIMDELFLQDSNVPEALETFIARYTDYTGGNGRTGERGPWYGKTTVAVFGDPSGAGRSQAIDSRTSARSNWGIIRDGLRRAGIPAEFRIQMSDPGQWNRVNAVNAQFGTGAGRGMLIDAQRCPNLIADLELVKWSKTAENAIEKPSSLKNEEDGKRTHLSDALAYFVFVDRAQAERRPLTLKSYLDFK